MITNLSYYAKGENRIPASQTANVPLANDLGNTVKLVDFIAKYEKEFLLNSLGLSLYNQFASNFTVNVNGFWTINPGAAQKWKDLLNGLKYVDNDGNEVIWKGLIYADIGTTPNLGLLAQYVSYKFFEQDNYNYASVGLQTEKSKNSERINPIPLLVTKWNDILEYTQGSCADCSPNVYIKDGVTIYDYYGSVAKTNRFVSLYEFIRDQNELVSDTFTPWNPQNLTEGQTNRFGL